MRLWDVGELEPLSEPLAGHAPQNVQDLAFAGEADTFASAGSDATVRLWTVAGRRASRAAASWTHRFRASASPSSPDGRTVASGGDDRTVRLWEGILWSDLDDLESQVCGIVVRNFTEAEWDELVPGLPYRTTCPT